MRAIDLLERELKKALSDGMDDEDEENEENDIGDKGSLKEGRLIVERHKKSENEKWQDLLVATL